MSMVQAYQGYFEKGRFKPLEHVTTVIIPDFVEVYVTVTGRVLNETDKVAIQADNERIHNRMETVDSLIGCMSGYDIDLDQVREERLKAKGLLT